MTVWLELRPAAPPTPDPSPRGGGGLQHSDLLPPSLWGKAGVGGPAGEAYPWKLVP
jgi:hypothetical protein